MVRLISFCLLLLFSLPVVAAQISVQTDRDPIASNETFRIIFTAEGSLDDEPDFSPLDKDFQLLGTSQSSSFNMVNGNISSSKTYTLTVTANREGKLTIPAISFGKDQSQPHTITILPASQATPSSPGNQPGSSASNSISKDDLFIKTMVDSSSPYVQQQVILTLKIFRRVEWTNASLSDIDIQGVETAIQPLGKEKSYETSLGGNRYIVTELRYALFPQASGEMTILPVHLTAKVATGQQQNSPRFGGTFDPFNDPFFDDFFSGRRKTYSTMRISSKPIKLDIKPIPASFKGKQWLPARDLKLQEIWSGDITKLEAGEPVTRTLAVMADGLGVGLLPKLEFNNLPNLKFYPDQPATQEQATGKGLLSTETYKLAIIPSRGGSYQLPAIEIPWWNTATDKPEVARIPTQTLKVKGPAAVDTTQSITDPPATEKRDIATTDNVLDTKSTTIEGPVSYQSLIIACAILLLLWLITFIAWWQRGKNMVQTTAEPASHKPDSVSLNASLKTLARACTEGDASEVRDALMQWSQACWPDSPPTSLEAIANKVTPEMAEQLHQLARSLYSDTPSSWDAGLILKQAEGFKNEQPAQPNSEAGLEPLYR